MYTRTPCKKLNCYIQKSLCKAGLIFIDDEITIVKCYILENPAALLLFHFCSPFMYAS